MIDHHIYVAEKLRQFDAAADRRQPPPGGRPRRRLLGPAARIAGRRMREFGQALEGWGSPVARDARL